MDEAQVSRLRLLFERGLAVPAEQRDRFLDEQCEGDRALRDEVASLLDAYGTSSGYFETLARQVLGPAVAVLAEGHMEFVVPGQIIGHYEIVGRMAAGGMGVVYKARDLRLDRHVALKFLPPQLSGDDAARARLLTEAKTASSLDHPNIAVVHEIGETADGCLFIAMRWYEGETLREKLRRGPLPVAEAVDIACQLAGALAAAHRTGIVHRDVKPSNVVITTDGVPKLLDFGIARLDGVELTRDGSTKGTVAYMSPEQARGGSVDHRTDLWSLGVLLYEMLAGRRPFAGEGEQATIYAIREDDPISLTMQRPEVTPSLAGIVYRCLQKEPAARYQGADALHADLGTPDGSTAAQASVTGAGGGTRTVDRSGWGGSYLRGRRRLGATVAGVGSPERLRALGGLAALAVLGALALYFTTARPAGAALDAKRVLVVPFENQTGDPELDLLGSVAALLISQGLAQTGAVDVVPETAALSAVRFVGGSSAPAATSQVDMLAAETGAGLVVSGAFYRQAGLLYLQATVTDATRQRVLYALGPITTPIDLPLDGIQDLRDRLLGLIAPHVNPRTQHHVAGGGGAPPSFASYRVHAQGMERFIERDWQSAIPLFMEAAGHDSTFTVPLLYAGISLHNMGNNAPVDSILARLRPRLHLLGEFEQLGFAMLDAALRGDHPAYHRAHRRAPEIAAGTLAHWGLANAAMRIHRPREALRTLGELDPERGELRGWFPYWATLAQAHHRLGQHRRELRALRRAGDLLPDHPGPVMLQVAALAGLGRTRAVHDLLAQHPDAEYRASLLRAAGLELIAHGAQTEGEALLRESLDRALARPEDGSGFRRFLAHAHYLAGEWDAAEELLHQLNAEYPETISVHGGLGAIAARRGDRAGALRADRWLSELDRPYLHGANTYWRARIAALLGEREAAVRLLHEAWQEGAFLMENAHIEVDFTPLHDYPPYRVLIRPRG
jgi:tRNA A-37 threonylcarbamoyl transferase component Bud32/TolB-like protein/tetratricopeptide (TPR) repeat protein